MDNDPTCRRKRLKLCHQRPIYRSRNVQPADLPEDLLSTILSKLPPSEIVKTGILSSKWKSKWKVCPELRFDALTMFATHVSAGHQYTQKFIDTVNAVMRQHQEGMVVEGLEIRCHFDTRLVDHIDTWLRFAVLSRTKSLALDLAPADVTGRTDQYRFPLELLDNGSRLRLQHFQLSFASFELSPQFSGFPNLRTLDLHFLRVTGKHLEDMLSNCVKLEWFSMVRCHLNDELKVARPLSNLMYLRVAHCKITKIVLNAMKLKTFEYRGRLYPIDLGYAPELKNSYLHFHCAVTLEHALITLPNVIRSVQDLIMHAYVPLKMPSLMENPCKFSQLKYLQLWLSISHEEAGNILSLASFLRAAPFIEKLEMHFKVFDFAHRVTKPMKSLPRCPHNYLKNLHITGFSGTTGQLEFLVYTVENAPALEILTIKGANVCGDDLGHEENKEFLFRFRELERRYLSGIISPNTKLSII